MDWPVCMLQVCNLVFDKFAKAEYQKVNKHPKFEANFDIQCEYDMNRTFFSPFLLAKGRTCVTYTFLRTDFLQR